MVIPQVKTFTGSATTACRASRQYCGSRTIPIVRCRNEPVTVR
jgi:hypothetical protein